MQISHYPKGYKQEKIVGMGLNADELKRNPVIDLQLFWIKFALRVEGEHLVASCNLVISERILG